MAARARYGRFMSEDHLYRRGVGVMLINKHNHVWVGRRIDNRDEAWQMLRSRLYEMCLMVPLRGSDFRKDVLGTRIRSRF